MTHTTTPTRTEGDALREALNLAVTLFKDSCDYLWHVKQQDVPAEEAMARYRAYVTDRVAQINALEEEANRLRAQYGHGEH